MSNEYPLDELKSYTEEKISKIADIILDVEQDLSEREFKYFLLELGDYFNKIFYKVRSK